MGGGSFSSSSSSSSSTPRTPGTAIGGGILADLFGLPTKISNGKLILDGRQSGTNMGGFSGARETPYDTMLKRQEKRANWDAGDVPYGGIGALGGADIKPPKPRKLRTGGAFAQQAFGVDEFGNPIDPSQNTGFGAIGQLLQQTNPFADDFLNVMDQGITAQRNLFGASSEQLLDIINSGGSPTDVSGLLNSGIADLKEQFSSTGGLYGSDVQNEALRFGGELGYQASEAAKARQLNAMSLAPGLAESSQSFGAGLLGLGADYERVGTAGGRALDLFNTLFGQQSPNLFSEGAVSKSKSSSMGVGVSGGMS